MTYIYVFPVKGYRRNSVDNRLFRDYAKGNKVERYTVQEFVELFNDKDMYFDNYWIKAIEEPDTENQP